MAENELYNEKELLVRLAEGDKPVFAHIFSTHFRQMCYYAGEMIADSQVAEDLVVETFVKLHQKKPVFDSLGKLKSYLFTVLHNAALDYIKANARHKLAQEEINHRTAHTSENAELLMIRAEALNELHREIALLPSQCSQVIYKIFVEGKTIREISEEMGLAYQTVLNQKTRGITLLKSSFLKNNLLSPVILWSLCSMFK